MPHGVSYFPQRVKCLYTWPDFRSFISGDGRDWSFGSHVQIALGPTYPGVPGIKRSEHEADRLFHLVPK